METDEQCKNRPSADWWGTKGGRDDGGGWGVDRLLNVSESEVRQRKEGGWIMRMDGRCLLTKRHVRRKRYYRKIWYVILSSSK